MHNICDSFLTSADKYSKSIAFEFYDLGSKSLSWHDLTKNICALIDFFEQNELTKGDYVAICADSSHFWAIADYACLFSGIISVPIYANQSKDDIDYILSEAKPKLLIIDSLERLSIWEEIKEQHKNINHVISFADLGESAVSIQTILNTKTTKELSHLSTLAKNIHLDDPASIVYTSGTTGIPKGVVITHKQINSEIEDIFDNLTINHKDKSLNLLPFAHILGRIELWGQAYAGYTIAFPKNRDSLRTAYQKLKPTFIVAVPRFFEKIYNAILSKVDVSPTKIRLFDWALDVGQEVSSYLMSNKDIPLNLGLKYKLAKNIAFKPIKEKLGGKLRFAICGGAKLDLKISTFFHAADILICEGYGLSETTGAITFNSPFSYKLGSVGKAFGDVQIKIAENDEILVKSKKVMTSYFNNKLETENVLKNGWLHTGDLGQIDSNGFLYITGRIKDVIKTSNGKLVAPQKLEDLLVNSPYISNAVIHGEGKKYIVALICLHEDNIIQYLSENNISYAGKLSLGSHPEVKKLIFDAVAETNSHLASYETIKNFGILSRALSVEAGELTPTLKVKRSFCDQKYKDLIHALYE